MFKTIYKLVKENHLHIKHFYSNQIKCKIIYQTHSNRMSSVMTTLEAFD